ncbi:MAG: carboxylesterase family protein [Lachnospiraceae bacterium]|nr:carboxylesterase family protein [Lachnospiraceae bacterium]
MSAYIGTVFTKYGAVRGVELTGRYAGITEFRGIPFAAPPVGPLRWRPPQAPSGWNGVRDCVSYAPICVQPANGDMGAEPWAGDFYYMGLPAMSEDCLYLNLCTKAAGAGEKRPVYLWFHGGGSDHGYSYEVEFNPAELAKKGIIVVSAAQRLGAFGYLALPQLTAEQGESGNYILMDEIMALQWVVENIEAFGGDPDNITVGGQSAGTGKAAALAFSPLGRMYVKRMIHESGLAWNRKYEEREAAELRCRDYLAALGIDPETSPEELRRINAHVFLDQKARHLLPKSLIYDGALIPDLSLAESTEKYGSRLDYLAGTNMGERRMRPDRQMFTNASEYYSCCRALLGPLYDQYDFEHLVPVTDETVHEVSCRLASYGLCEGPRMGGLALNRYFGMHRAQTAPGKNTFNYLFTRIIPGRPEDVDTVRDPKALLAWHSGELWYAFASMRRGIPPVRPWEDADVFLADQMSSYWANFIRTGDPNGEGLPLWPKSDESYGYIELGESIVGIDHRRKLDDMILEFLTERNVIPV